jgi:hypothetical protein
MVAPAQDGAHHRRNYESMDNERDSSSVSPVFDLAEKFTFWKYSASTYPLCCFNESLTSEIFERFGPTPRLCLDYQLNSLQMSQYKRNLDVAISEVTSDKLKSLLRTAASGDLRIDALSHKITLLSRKSLDDVHSQAVVIPITSLIQSRLSNQLRNLAHEEQLGLYEYFAKVPEGRKMAGVFFEALAQRVLQDGITLELVPMVKLNEARKERCLGCTQATNS